MIIVVFYTSFCYRRRLRTWQWSHAMFGLKSMPSVGLVTPTAHFGRVLLPKVRHKVVNCWLWDPRIQTAHSCRRGCIPGNMSGCRATQSSRWSSPRPTNPCLLARRCVSIFNAVPMFGRVHPKIFRPTCKSCMRPTSDVLIKSCNRDPSWSIYRIDGRDAR